jgi:hypothetical protein
MIMLFDLSSQPSLREDRVGWELAKVFMDRFDANRTNERTNPAGP